MVYTIFSLFLTIISNELFYHSINSNPFSYHSEIQKEDIPTF